eukprot:TRINITY_DN60385_c0_g1_i1.p2 TRINITY_DN60385_c0_g1~~TRINITY_DN60385_c0_g1_i1.p2  ORF type:complete len:118 (-),score=39.30 TRINITY_DN60385_c0_g1_i1:30-383(-)
MPGQGKVRMTLDEIKPGSRCVMIDLRTGGALGQRLMDLGFCPGANIEVVRNAPLVDPVVLHLDGTKKKKKKKKKKKTHTEQKKQKKKNKTNKNQRQQTSTRNVQHTITQHQKKRYTN